MNLVHLKYAVEVYKTGSITQAAENLYMGQPNLSKAVKELEASLDFTIFKRTTKGVVATEKGEAFLIQAKHILTQIDEMESHYRHNGKNRIAFSICVPRASYITHAFASFVASLDNAKALDINFRETNALNTIKNIYEGDFRLGIIRYRDVYERYFLDLLAEKELEYELIQDFEYVALMSKYHPLAELPEISVDALEEYTEIIHGDVRVPFLKKVAQEGKARSKIHIYDRGSQFDLLSQVHTTYMLVSPLPQEILDRHGFIQRKLCDSGGINKEVLIYPKGYKLSKYDRSFLQYLNEMVAQI